ncbi:3-oxoacid CoA-transferase subunit B [Allopusillimonas ginsengisoli]|uniref:3-oxoacid CoA-transferase subunit B n=1 Tax=Allopusillimonas ginsengisoli TaxID=453575 RepID=UPI00101FC49A|nr:3-oxoacid CoA-transferase subunit B [Allopusillimonas ginsengisoli]TEA80295.1 3-oxoacid CoA-transferase subunit B [Allopusillimonas ginsengisoli]
MQGYSRTQLAARVARDIEDGWYVNLGIGTPEKVADYIPSDKEIILHSENGILGMGETVTDPAQVDWDLINAGKRPIALRQGGSFFDHVTSFSMMRGGHLDLCLLGAYQVSEQGDLANWWTGGEGEMPAVGGAMDLVTGARRLYVMMDHVSKAGEPKIVNACTYPLTGKKVVDRIYTDFAVIDVASDGLLVRELVDSITFETLQQWTQAPLMPAADMRIVTIETRETE